MYVWSQHEISGGYLSRLRQIKNICRTPNEIYHHTLKVEFSMEREFAVVGMNFVLDELAFIAEIPVNDKPQIMAPHARIEILSRGILDKVMFLSGFKYVIFEVENLAWTVTRFQKIPENLKTGISLPYIVFDY